MDIDGWLRRVGLAQYAEMFRANDIDAELLGRLTSDDLKDIGVASFGHRKKLLEAIAELGGVPAPPPQPLGAAWLTSAVLGADPRLYIDEWLKVKEEQAQAAAERAAREEKEREAKTLKNHHGPRWWERGRA